jgi:hypothetical protein
MRKMTMLGGKKGRGRERKDSEEGGGRIGVGRRRGRLL